MNFLKTGNDYNNLSTKEVIFSEFMKRTYEYFGMPAKVTNLEHQVKCAASQNEFTIMNRQVDHEMIAIYQSLQLEDKSKSEG